MKTLLSIVIPTYNSEDVIGPNLATLLPQVKIYQSVELIVINNGSTDCTGEVIQSYFNTYPDSFIYIEREKVISPEDNFFDGVSKTKGEYVLLLGDDDILSSSFLDTILPFLDGKIGLFHFNRIECRDNFTNNQLFRKTNVGIESFTVYEDGRHFIEEYTSEFNFMSSVVFKKSVWEKGQDFVKLDMDYFGYYWYATIAFGLNHAPCVYFNFPLVMQRVRGHSWSRDWALYGIVGMFSIYRDLDRIMPGIYEHFYNKHHNVKRKVFFSTLGSIYKYAQYYRNKKYLFSPFLNKKEKILFSIYTSKFTVFAKLLNHIVIRFS